MESHYQRRNSTGAKLEPVETLASLGVTKKRATRRMGELLKEMEKNVGAKGSKVAGSKREPVKDTTPTLASLGVTKKQSHEAQRLAGRSIGGTTLVLPKDSTQTLAGIVESFGR